VALPFDGAIGYLWSDARAPLSIVYRNGLPLDGSHPALLDGYGSHGLTKDPNFLAITLLWLEHGGVYAVAHATGSAITTHCLSRISHLRIQPCPGAVHCGQGCDSAVLRIRKLKLSRLNEASRLIEIPGHLGDASCQECPPDASPKLDPTPQPIEKEELKTR
jgi:hypothetical protein